MSIALTAELVLLFILVAALNTAFSLSNSRNVETMGVSEQRKSSSVSANCTNSILVDPTENIQITSTSKTLCMASRMLENFDDLVDTEISEKFEAILQFENILVAEKFKLLSSLSKEECDYNYQRILRNTFREKRSCYDDINFVIAAARMRIQWALEMIDANGKPGFGTLHDVAYSIGDFDKCMEVDTGQDFEGGYCTTNILISKIQQTGFSPPLRISLGLCFPSSCDGVDVERFINEYFQSRDDIIAMAARTQCQERHLKLSTKAKIVISICSIYATLLVVATVYDGFYKRWWLKINKNGNNNMDNNVSNGKAPSVTNKSRSDHEPIMDSEKQKTKLYAQDEAATPQKPNKSEMLDQFLMTFSVYTNTAKLFSTHETKGSIGCIHGMRFLSTTGIIIVHLLPWGTTSTDNLKEYLDDIYERWTFMILFKGDTNVDTFFTIGGLVMAYVVMNELSKKAATPKFFANFYLHRVWRVLPPCLLIMMTYVPLIKYAGEGPFWPQGGFEKDECKDSWWYPLLYINNFISMSDWCMGWTWYLSCDMQFYIISPLMFLPLLYYGWKGLLSPLAFLLASAICSGVISSANDLIAVPNLQFLLTGVDDNYISSYYVKPYTRIGPYIIGLITGYLIFKSEMKAQLPKWMVILGWTAATATALAVVFGPYGHVEPGHILSTEVRALYNALSRIAWGMSVCWVIFACANGCGGFVNTLLSWKAFLPLSRLSFCAYLVHPIAVQYFIYTRGSVFHLNNAQLTSLFVTSTAITYLLAYVAYMAYEVPMTGLERIVKGHAKKKE